MSQTTARWLRHRGHPVTCLREVLPTTTADPDAWQWARAHAAVFVSCNRDDILALRPEGEHPGIVILVRPADSAGGDRRDAEAADRRGRAGSG